MKTIDFKPMTPEAARQICSWRYESPYNVYDYITYEEALKTQAIITKPENADNYLCFWNNETLLAYASIILKKEKVFIGIGVAPQFCGQGLGNIYLNKTVCESQNRYPDKEIWVQVRSWNERAIKCYLKNGFVEKYRETDSDRFNRSTEFLFMRYEDDITFAFLNKSDFPTLANELFSILADNMEKIAPTGNAREADFKCWFDGVSGGIKHDERQIVLIKKSGGIIGFFQYYSNADTFMMEEIQLRPDYQKKGIFRKLYGFLIDNMNSNIRFVEAYANKNNSKSIGILKKLGLEKIGINKNGCSLHFKGVYNDLLKWYNKKSTENNK